MLSAFEMQHIAAFVNPAAITTFMRVSATTREACAKDIAAMRACLAIKCDDIIEKLCQSAVSESFLLFVIGTLYHDDFRCTKDWSAIACGGYLGIIKLFGRTLLVESNAYGFAMVLRSAFEGGQMAVIDYLKQFAHAQGEFCETTPAERALQGACQSGREDCMLRVKEFIWHDLPRYASSNSTDGIIRALCRSPDPVGTLHLLARQPELAAFAITTQDPYRFRSAIEAAMKMDCLPMVDELLRIDAATYITATLRMTLTKTAQECQPATIKFLRYKKIIGDVVPHVIDERSRYCGNVPYDTAIMTANQSDEYSRSVNWYHILGRAAQSAPASRLREIIAMMAHKKPHLRLWATIFAEACGARDEEVIRTLAETSMQLGCSIGEQTWDDGMRRACAMRNLPVVQYLISIGKECGWTFEFAPYPYVSKIMRIRGIIA